MNNLITKSFLMLAAVFVTVFASSCTDQLSSIAPVSDDASMSSFTTLYDAESMATTITDDHDMGLSAKGDRRGRGPGRGHGKDSVDGGRGDGISPKRAHLRQVIDCLKLTPEQLKMLTSLQQTKNDCVKTARETFKSTVGPIKAEEKALHKSLHEQLDAGTITRADANAQVEAFLAKNGPIMQAAAEALKTSVQGCNEAFLAAIEAMLTPEQLLLWNQWKATGTNPCDTGDVIGG